MPKALLFPISCPHLLTDYFQEYFAIDIPIKLVYILLPFWLVEEIFETGRGIPPISAPFFLSPLGKHKILTPSVRLPEGLIQRVQGVSISGHRFTR